MRIEDRIKRLERIESFMLNALVVAALIALGVVVYWLAFDSQL